MLPSTNFLQNCNRYPWLRLLVDSLNTCPGPRKNVSFDVHIFYRKDTEPLSCVSNISQFKKCDVLARITLTWLFYFW